MRLITSRNIDNLELQLIQETSQQLTFQQGKIPQSKAMSHKWRTAIAPVIALSLFCIIMFSIVWKGGIVMSVFSNPIGVNLFLLIWAMVMFGIPIAIICVNLFKAYSVVWTFDQLDRTLRREGITLFGQKWVCIYRFEDVQQIGIEQHWDSHDKYRKCCELYLVLKSGREFTMSRGLWLDTGDKHEQAISLQHHRDIAKKMRNCLGHPSTPASEKLIGFVSPVQEK